MEKLKKLSDFKCNELNSNAMFSVKGSMKECTGGGFHNEYCTDGNGGYILYCSTSWTSDVKHENGHIIYHNERLEFGDCATGE